MPGRSEARNLLSGNLAREIALRVARAVEIDRLDGKTLPHDMALTRLRPALRSGNGSERTPSPLRFFCRPFEDLLAETPGRTEKQKGRISRASVAPTWNWVETFLLPLETKTYCRKFKAAVAAADHAAGKAQAAIFWALAAEAMRGALASEAGRNAARQFLKNDLVFADAEEIALLLGAAPAVMAIQETVVRATPELTEEHLLALRAIHNALLESASAAAPYVALIAMNRLARP